MDTGITAVITVEEDMRFLRSTLRSVLTQNVLPGVVIIADATGRTSSRITTSFEVIPSPSGPVMEVPQSKHVIIHIVSAKGASWGMFDNFEQRGDIFKEIVNSL